MSDLSPLLNALDRVGYAISDGLIDRPLAESLRLEAGTLHADHVFQPAGVGGGIVPQWRCANFWRIYLSFAR